MNDNFGIVEGLMTTVHAMTANQLPGPTNATTKKEKSGEKQK